MIRRFAYYYIRVYTSWSLGRRKLGIPYNVCIHRIPIGIGFGEANMRKTIRRLQVNSAVSRMLSAESTTRGTALNKKSDGKELPPRANTRHHDGR